MKIIIFSDSHRELDGMRTVIAQEKPDYVFHLGDHDTDAEALMREYDTLPIVTVRGNCDGWSDTPKTRVFNLGGKRFFLCHGHTLGVKEGYLRATYAALEQKADVLLFGHTHIPCCACEETEPGQRLYLLNPGSCGGYRPTYGRILLEPGREIEIDCFKI